MKSDVTLNEMAHTSWNMNENYERARASLGVSSFSITRFIILLFSFYSPRFTRDLDLAWILQHLKLHLHGEIITVPHKMPTRTTPLKTSHLIFMTGELFIPLLCEEIRDAND